MSETRPVYQIRTWTGDPPVKPQGEICQRYDEPEPDTEPEETDCDRELFLAQLDGWIRELNLAANVIKPFIVQRRKTIIGKNGKEKVVVPCMTDLYKVFTEMQEALFQLRKDGYREGKMRKMW